MANEPTTRYFAFTSLFVTLQICFICRFTCFFFLVISIAWRIGLMGMDFWVAFSWEPALA